MGSSAAARVLLVVGFLAAWIGYDAFLVSHIVLDPNTTRAAASALLQTPAVRTNLADDLDRQIASKLPAAAQDPRVRAAVNAAVRDPRVTAVFADTVAQIHEAVLSGSKTQTFTVDGNALSAALHDALAQSAPQLAAQVQNAPPLTVQLQPGSLPRLHDPRSAAGGVALLGIVAALLFITASLLLSHRRRAVGKVGRRTAYLAITPLVVFAVLPRVLSSASGEGPQIASALLRVYGHRVLPSAIALVVVGASVAIGAIAWPRTGSATEPSMPPVTPRRPGDSTTAPRPRVAPDQPEITERIYL